MEKHKIRIKKFSKYIKFTAYLFAVILLNMAGMTLFARIDLTANKIYSLSKASTEAVKNLSEPLTIHVFFTRNLPAPHNSVERYLHDLLGEYGAVAGKKFSYRFHDVSPDDSRSQSSSVENQKLAENYGVYPVQIQAIENDEIKFQKAYMGLVLIHGDLVERIPAIATTDGLEYQITTAIQKLGNKVSVLLGLKDQLHLRLYKSSSLDVIAPYIGLKELPRLGQNIEITVKKLNEQLYGKLTYSFLDPSLDQNLEKEVADLQILNLKWPEFPSAKISAGQGVIGLVMQYGDKIANIPVLQIMQIPIIGTQYHLLDTKAIEEAINQQIENLIGINEDIGYLADRGTPNLYGSPMGPGQPGAPEEINSFRALVSKTYNIKPVSLDNHAISENFNCLVLAGPTEVFSEYDLFQIDQYLMKGKNLAIFLDAMKEVDAQSSMFTAQGPQYAKLDTGLEKLLDHYGINIKHSMVMDENSFKQQVPQNFGGGERNIYFAPMIKNEYINKDFQFMKTIKGLVAYKMSPLSVDTEKLAKNGIKDSLIFSSSPKSWEMDAPLILNPMFIQPPKQQEGMKSSQLAYVLEGEFPSYFAGKPVPDKPQRSPDESSESAEKKPLDKSPMISDLSRVEGEIILNKGKPGKIFIMGSSEMLKDNILEDSGRSPNAVFILNILDYLNNREDLAVLRSKEQKFNPLAELSPVAKTIIKSLNIAGLPALVVIFGLGVWFRKKSRMRKIQLMFKK